MTYDSFGVLCGGVWFCRRIVRYCKEPHRALQHSVLLLRLRLNELMDQQVLHNNWEGLLHFLHSLPSGVPLLRYLELSVQRNFPAFQKKMGLLLYVQHLNEGGEDALWNLFPQPRHPA